MPEARQIALGTTRAPYHLSRSARRTLEIAVTVDGRIEVRAPRDLPVERIEARLRARARWIRRRLHEHELTRPALAPRTYTAGESHRYLGRQYRLSVASGRRASVRPSSGRLVVLVPDSQDFPSVRRALERWYLARAKTVLPVRLDRLLAQPCLHGLQPAAIRVQRMRKRWGSCSSSGRLLLNTDLVLLPVSLIDYVLVHELCHLRVRSHGAEFERQLARALPDWRARHRQLGACRLD